MRIQIGGIVAPLLLVTGLFVSGCAANAKPVKQPVEVTNNVFYATLYLQTAAEYKANVIQTYNAAAANIDVIGVELCLASTIVVIPICFFELVVAIINRAWTRAVQIDFGHCFDFLNMLQVYSMIFTLCLLKSLSK